MSATVAGAEHGSATGRIASSSEACTEASVRAAVRGWIQDNWDPELPLLEWRQRLVDSRWARPSWDPRCYGKGLPEWADGVVGEELARAAAIGNPIDRAVLLAVTALFEHASEEMQQRFVRAALTGEQRWCQLFSEPGAGSDLASITTSAMKDGDAWTIAGQKLWVTSADHADFALLLARTNWDVPKHKGLTMFALPMRQPGIELRPIRQMNDHCSFNEVFITDARAPTDHVIGAVGDGWSVAMTTLGAERGLGTVTRPAFPEDGGRAVAEAIEEADTYFETYKWYPQRSGRVDLVLEYAHRSQRTTDPVTRQAIASLISLHRVAEWTSQRRDSNLMQGKTPGPEGSIGKLLLSRIAREASSVHTLLAGPYTQLGGAWSPDNGLIAEIVLSVPAQSIAGGTDEVQRNIIAERVLGLPREPSADAGMPFRESRRHG